VYSCCSYYCSCNKYKYTAPLYTYTAAAAAVYGCCSILQLYSCSIRRRCTRIRLLYTAVYGCCSILAAAVYGAAARSCSPRRAARPQRAAGRDGFERPVPVRDKRKDLIIPPRSYNSPYKPPDNKENIRCERRGKGRDGCERLVSVRQKGAVLRLETVTG
jgi:hypothetical protein